MTDFAEWLNKQIIWAERGGMAHKGGVWEVGYITGLMHARKAFSEQAKEGRT